MEISGEGDMSQEQLVEQTTSILETVRKINEALKDTKISELCEKLEAYAKALDAIVNRKHHMFTLHFAKIGHNEYKIGLYADDVYIYTIYVQHDVTIDSLFESIFTNQELRNKLINDIYETLSEIAHEVAERADLVKQIKEIKQRLEEEDPDPVF
jgi:hypothetical protein